MSDSILYFAFGSNLHAPQMYQRCPGCKVLQPAVLEGFRLAFSGFSKNWGGGAATIVPADDRTVQGLLYHLTADDVQKLNRFESYPAVYQHEQVTVTARDGTQHTALTYVKLDPKPNAPSVRYLFQIWRGFRAHGLDEALLHRAVEEVLEVDLCSTIPWRPGFG